MLGSKMQNHQHAPLRRQDHNFWLVKINMSDKPVNSENRQTLFSFALLERKQKTEYQQTFNSSAAHVLKFNGTSENNPQIQVHFTQFVYLIYKIR